MSLKQKQYKKVSFLAQKISLICFHVFRIFLASKNLLEIPMYQCILILIELKFWMKNGSVFSVISFLI